MVKGMIGESRFSFLNLYAPNEDCPLFFLENSDYCSGNDGQIGLD